MSRAAAVYTLCALVVVSAVGAWLITGREGYTRWPDARLAQSDAPPAEIEGDLLADIGFDSGNDTNDTTETPDIKSRFAFGIAPGGLDPKHMPSIATFGVIAVAMSCLTAVTSLRRKHKTSTAPTGAHTMNTLTHKAQIAATLTAIGMISFAGAAIATQDPPNQIPEPPIPAATVAQGTVYHTLTGREAQVTFTSKAPLESIVGKSNAVVGYAVAGPDDAPANLVGAQWILPVDSLATGIPLRDEHIAGHEWLNAESFPVISFTLTSTEDVTPVKSGDGFSTWSLTLVGDMTMRGQSHPVRVEDARLSFLKASEKTAKIADGDLCFLKCVYRIRMSDFGIKHKDVPDKVADEIELRQMLRMSTAQP